MKRLGRSVVGVLMLALVAVAVSRVYTLMTDPLFDNTASRDSIDEIDARGSFNALLVGADNSGVLADAIMLVNVDRQNSKISLLSIPRDTKVLVDKSYKKINSCYSLGIDCLIDEVKQLTGVYINYYAVIQPGALASIVDALGGVELTVEQDMKYSDPSQDLYIDLKAGTQTLNGDMAEQYCRYRLYTMGDYDRTKAQQKFFKAFFEQKLNAKNITKLYDIYTSLEGKVSTNVTFSDIASNIDVMQMLTSGTVDCYDCPGHFNDMQKEGISYYIIENDQLNDLRNICFEHFTVN